MTSDLASPLLPVSRPHHDDHEKRKCYCSQKIMATVFILDSLIAFVLFAAFFLMSTIHSQDPGQFYITSTDVIPFPNSIYTTITFDLSIYNPNQNKRDPADYHSVRAFIEDDSLLIPRKELLFETEAPPVHPRGSNVTMASSYLEIDDPEVAARITGGDRVDIILLVEKTKPSWMQYWRSNDQVVVLCPNVLFTDDSSSGTSDHPYKCRVV